MSTNTRGSFSDLLSRIHPLLLAPMAGSGGLQLALAVAQEGGLAALPAASVSGEQLEKDVHSFRAATGGPLNLNYFAHRSPEHAEDAMAAWRERLAPYYRQFGLAETPAAAGGGRAPFDAASCALVEALRPEVVSFHFGLPDKALLDRVMATGALVISSATTVTEAQWLAQRGCHAIIAQGAEAGGHRASFLTDDMATQVGTMALVAQMVDAVDVPVIAAGGIGDARGIRAALALGASAVQLGTAFLRSPEVMTTSVHREALRNVRDDSTAITNVFTGRPARGIINRLMREVGPMTTLAPPFPLAASALAPLRAHTEPQGSGDFQPLWAGQAAALAREAPAAEIMRELIAGAFA
ncbi:nitronate monooxygenase [Luteibacter sp. Sphag1AF]|uniref:NAD(P)H-dependent flavin oxidoreductase n=1 Tax=Luteibacter sp. Sphag1AF TaxID=2587031 RepID=UPI00161C6079|nr:nitronate monooxygenase family protein [Luteibacter sp. Sphag1AF]MBB3228654.1 nitronate monooxygenase [Luteibacter sp. Sphag1AF]